MCLPQPHPHLLYPVPTLTSLFVSLETDILCAALFVQFEKFLRPVGSKPAELERVFPFPLRSPFV